jgi:uncharacterized damage-inducible protein DinB
MSIATSLLPEFDQEMASTRKILECVPDDKSEYRPHPKSMPLGRLAGHVAELASWGATTINTDVLEITPDFVPFVAESRQQLLETFDKHAAAAREAIAGASDEHYFKTWELKFSGKTMMSLPRIAVLRTVVMNHLIHHRAQLGVYLRMNDIAIPGMYGPSADDPKWWEVKA